MCFMVRYKTWTVSSQCMNASKAHSLSWATTNRRFIHYSAVLVLSATVRWQKYMDASKAQRQEEPYQALMLLHREHWGHDVVLRARLHWCCCTQSTEQWEQSASPSTKSSSSCCHHDLLIIIFFVMIIILRDDIDTCEQMFWDRNHYWSFLDKHGC